MRAFIFGLIIGFVLIAAGAYIYFSSGMAPVATSAAAMPFEARLAAMALHARVEKEMPKSPPFTPDEAAYRAGAQVYRNTCAVCHGIPAHLPTPVARGMYPKPPQLFHGHGVTDDPPGETYWKVANGIRLTGMPGFKGAMSDTQMWDVSLMLANADKLPPPVNQELAADLPGFTRGSAPPETSQDHVH